jgi:hypothetical protein
MNYQKPVVAMVSNALLASTAGVVATLGISALQPALGATVTYDFSVNIPAGNSYAGTHNGSFSYDDSTSLVPCKGTQSVNGQPVQVDTVCAVPEINSLAVQFNFLGNTYTEQQDFDYTPNGSKFPSLYFPTVGTIGSAPDFLGGLSFLVVPPTSPVGFFIVGSDFFVGNIDDGDPYDSGTQVGSVLYALRPITPPDPEPEPPPDTGGGDEGDDDGEAVAVPEPSEIAGSAIAVGMLGAAWYWRRKKVKPVNLDRD